MTANGCCRACGAPLPPNRAPGRRRQWCSERCRKSQYAGTCEVCGGPTSGANPGRGVAQVCQACHEWPEPAIIRAIRDWADLHDGVPPRVEDWHTAAADYPSSYTVVKRMGWNNALLAAGFELHQDRRPETQEWVITQVRAGVPTREIATALGVTPEAIYKRLQYRGLTMAAVRGKTLA